VIPGPDQIVACPHCRGLGKFPTLMSGNTFGARLWTDGKQVAPMLPSPPAVAKCRHCGRCYWLADAEEVGTIGPWGRGSGHVDPAWVAAASVVEPTEEEYYVALEAGLAKDRRRERDLRVLAWWRGNDAFRDASHAQAGDGAADPAPRRNNLHALAELLDEKDVDDRIMKAEVLRELADFEAATGILATITSSDYGAVVRQLRSLCDGQDPRVRELDLR
jgi:hypothetical protein